MEYFPEAVQAVPNDDFTVTVYFSDGKIVLYNMKPHLDKGVFKPLKDINIFKKTCTVLNYTLAFDLEGNRDETKCIDIDPFVIYELPMYKEALLFE